MGIFPVYSLGVYTGKSPVVKPLIESDDSLHTVNSIDGGRSFGWEWFTHTKGKASLGMLASYTQLSY